MLSLLLNTYGIPHTGKESFPGNATPLPKKYIAFQTGAEMQSQMYDHFPLVITLIKDVLSRHNISILQFGDLTDPLLPNVEDKRGLYSTRHVSYVLENALLSISCNLFTAELCRIHSKPTIFLNSNFPRKNLPKENGKLVLLEPERTEKFSFQDKEDYKLINSIRPELVADSILKAIYGDSLEFEVPIRSIQMGQKYGHQIIDFIPDAPLPNDLIGKTINIRLDLFDNRDILPIISNNCPIFITTKKAISLDNLNQKNIKGITLFCDSDVDISFVEKCVSSSLTIFVICINEEKLNDIRLSLLGIKEVYKKIKHKSLDFSEKGDIYYNSSRFYIGRNKMYPSLLHYKKDLSINNANVKFDPAWASDEDFLEGADSFYFFTNESIKNIQQPK